MTPTPISFQVEGGALSALRWDGPPGAPTLVFSHATGFNARTYRRLLAPLADAYTLIALDARGHGHSDATASPQALKGWCRYWADLLHILRPDGPLPPGRLYLAGHSLGAIVSLEAARRLPERVAGVALIEPVIPPPLAMCAFGLAKALGQADRFQIAARAARRRVIWPSRAVLLETYTGRGAFKSWGPGWVEDYLDGGLRTLPTGEVSLTCAPAWEARTFQTTATGTWRTLRHIPVPLLIVGGAGSDTFPRRSAGLVPAWHHVSVVPETTHFLPMEAPELVRDLLRALPETLGRGRPPSPRSRR